MKKLKFYIVLLILCFSHTSYAKLTELWDHHFNWTDYLKSAFTDNKAGLYFSFEDTYETTTPIPQHFFSLHGRDGGKRWSININGSSDGIATTDGTLLINEFENLVAYDRVSGQKLWSTPTIRLIAKILLSPDEKTIYVANHWGELSAIDRNANTLWTIKIKLPHDITTHTPTIGADSNIYIPDSGGALHVIDANGKIVWEKQNGNDDLYSILVNSHSKSLYIASVKTDHSAKNYQIFKIDLKTHHEIWRKNLGTLYYGKVSNIAFSPDRKTIYYLTSYFYDSDADKNTVVALNEDGTAKWSYSLGGEDWQLKLQVLPNGNIIIYDLFSISEISSKGTLISKIDVKIWDHIYEQTVLLSKNGEFLYAFGRDNHNYNPDFDQHKVRVAAYQITD